MKFIHGGDLSFEELERIMFLGGLKKRKDKLEREKSASRNRSRSPDREPTVTGEAAPVSAEMEFMEKTSMKLQYAVMCKKVPAEANELELFKFFTFNGGKMRDVAILYNGERPSGTAFVEFLEFNSVRTACSHANPEIFGKSMIVRAAQDVQNDMQNAHGANGRGERPDTLNRRLRITNLLAVITESDMLGIFRPFGDIEAIDMHRKDGRKVCEIAFTKEADARDAMSSMAGFELAGQPLKLMLGDGTSAVTAPPPPAPPFQQLPFQQFQRMR